MIWPRCGSLNRYQKRATSTRSPTIRVFSIDSDGIRYGLTTNHCTRYAAANASATTTTSSTHGPSTERTEPNTPWPPRLVDSRRSPTVT